MRPVRDKASPQRRIRGADAATWRGRRRRGTAGDAVEVVVADRGLDDVVVADKTGST